MSITHTDHVSRHHQHIPQETVCHQELALLLERRSHTRTQKILTEMYLTNSNFHYSTIALSQWFYSTHYYTLLLVIGFVTMVICPVGVLGFKK